MSASDRTTTAIEIDAVTRQGLHRAPFCSEIELLLLAGIQPNVYLYAGTDCWEKAKHRRAVHGAGSALVLPAETDPCDLRWPAVEALVVCWPTTNHSDYRNKILLAQALVRDGVRYAAIEHKPEWLNVYRAGVLMS
ncbi:hypothetical protein [Pseudoxanthomonas kalamensis]|uniref:hypothetical protein n=1 Tax=Pseudoxanthomonas kalamensis TaxID=289483 RepID=UPI001390FC09|nr:hypothetical protein [Pseudoxanthomonas kalamensis]